MLQSILAEGDMQKLANFALSNDGAAAAAAQEALDASQSRQVSNEPTAALRSSCLRITWH